MIANKESMEQWFDTQKKVFDFWQDCLTLNMNSKNKKDVQQENSIANIFEESMKGTQEAIKKWVDFSSDLYTKSNNGIYNNAYRQDVFNKMLNGANVYLGLNKFWAGLNSNIIGQESDPLKFYKKWNEEYGKMLTNNFISFLPEQMQTFIREPLETYSLFTDTNQTFLQPWFEGAQEFQNLLGKITTGDKDAYIKFNRLWYEKYSSTFGKIFNLPQFSINREQMQKQMHSMDTLINFSNNINEFMTVITKVNEETLVNIIKDYQEMLVNGTNPKTYKEFYEYWWRKNEVAYQNLFGTAEFSKLFSQVLDAGVNFKKDFDALLEKQLNFLPYPTRTDMDSVYKTLDDLKRDVRALKKEVATLTDKAKDKVTNTGKSAKED